MRRRVELGIGSVAREGRGGRRRGGHKRRAAAGFMPSASAKDATDERKRGRCTLVQGERDSRLPVKKGQKKKKKVDERQKWNRNTRVGIGNALRTDITPSNVGHVGPGGRRAGARLRPAKQPLGSVLPVSPRWARSMTRQTGLVPPPGGKEAEPSIPRPS